MIGRTRGRPRTRFFARQIRWLQKRFSLVSLEEAQRRILEGCNREPCLSITFDDGYADNCRQAIPLLIGNRIPCTYFVTVRNVLSGRAVLARPGDGPPSCSEQP